MKRSRLSPRSNVASAAGASRSSEVCTAMPFIVQYDVRGGSIRKTGKSASLTYSESRIKANDVYRVLEESLGQPQLVNRYTVIFYNNALHGWECLKRGADISEDVLKRKTRANKPFEFSPEVPRLHVMLEDTLQLPVLPLESSPQSRSMESRKRAFGIGIYQGKTAYNLITLQRSATQLGAEFAFSIQDRFRDRTPLMQNVKGSMVPLLHFHTLLSFSKDMMTRSPSALLLQQPKPLDEKVSSVEGGWEWVGIEMGGKPLLHFEHPERAVYILGSEDNGLSSMLRGACKHVIELPSVRSESFNVAVAGSLIMYDRMRKAKMKSNPLAYRQAAGEYNTEGPSKKRKSFS